LCGRVFVRCALVLSGCSGGRALEAVDRMSAAGSLLHPPVPAGADAVVGGPPPGSFDGLARIYAGGGGSGHAARYASLDCGKAAVEVKCR